MVLANTYHLALRPGEKIVAEHGGLHEVAVRKIALGEARATAEEGRAFLLRDLHVVQVAFELRFAHGWAHGHARLQAVAHDDGLGFAPEEATRIFKKFYRIGDELRRNTQGTGLGLYIVQQLARLAGARITASSPGPRLGATMTLIWSDSYLA